MVNMPTTCQLHCDHCAHHMAATKWPLCPPHASPLVATVPTTCLPPCGHCAHHMPPTLWPTHLVATVPNHLVGKLPITCQPCYDHYAHPPISQTDVGSMGGKRPSATPPSIRWGIIHWMLLDVVGYHSTDAVGCWWVIIHWMLLDVDG